MGPAGHEPGTHLEEIRRHLLLHQVALDVLSGTLREGLGRTEVAVSPPQGLPSPPRPAPVAQGTGLAGESRAAWPLTCEQASSSFMM